MADIKLKELLRKYLDGSATPEEQKLVDDWYETLSEKEEGTLTDYERVDLRNEYWRGLKHDMRRYSVSNRGAWPLLGVAASVAIIFCAVVFFMRTGSPQTTRPVAVTSADDNLLENNTAAVRKVYLPDSSMVALTPGSYIRVAPAFNVTTREITLTGEAFFEISRDEQKPFYVIANEVTTKVLGTSFTVKAYPYDKDITVAVKSGRVSVYTHERRGLGGHQSGSVVLVPNQQIVYKREEGTVLKALVEKPQVIIPEDEVKKIRFEGMPVAEIFKALEKMYGVDIEFTEADFEKCTMTTSANGKDLYERIDVICEITGATYKIDEMRIRIEGPGCN